MAISLTIKNNDREDRFNVNPFGQGISIPMAAIYTIWTFNPKTGQYPLLYVGQSGNLEERLTSNHHKYSSWFEHAVQGLYCGYWLLPTDQFSKEQRFALESDLIRAHKPICND
jgi:hypothetical protein